MTTHSSILAWKIPWTVEPDEQLRTHTHTSSQVGVRDKYQGSNSLAFLFLLCHLVTVMSNTFLYNV